MVTNRDRALDSPQQNGSSKVVHFCLFLPCIPILYIVGVCRGCCFLGCTAASSHPRMAALRSKRSHHPITKNNVVISNI
jgi:hypothetical protein